MKHWPVPNQYSGSANCVRLCLILSATLIMPFTANSALAAVDVSQCPSGSATSSNQAQSASADQIPTAIAQTIAPPSPQIIAKPQDFEASAPQNKRTGYPKWRDFPPPPQHVASDKDVKTGVDTLTTSRLKLIENSKNLIWTLDNPQAFAQNAYARIKSVYLVAGLQYNCADAIGFALKKQKASTPPPLSAVGEGLRIQKP